MDVERAEEAPGEDQEALVSTLRARAGPTPRQQQPILERRLPLAPSDGGPSQRHSRTSALPYCSG